MEEMHLWFGCLFFSKGNAVITLPFLVVSSDDAETATTKAVNEARAKHGHALDGYSEGLHKIDKAKPLTIELILQVFGDKP